MQVLLQPMEAPTTTDAGQRILDAASRLFYTRGINATGVDLIASEADVTKRTLYQRFGSKDNLVAAYLQCRAHIWQTYLVDGFADSDEPILDALYVLTTRWVVRNPRGCAFVNASVEISGIEHPAWDVIRHEKAWMHQLFDVIADGDTELSMTLYLLFEGAQTATMLHGSTEPFEVAQSASIRLLTASMSERFFGHTALKSPQHRPNMRVKLAPGRNSD